MGLLPMARMITRSLFGKPSTKMYPLNPQKHFENTRGRIEIKQEDCIYCGMCSRKCPSQAIEVKRAEKEWTINPMRCITCSYCVEVCPKKCLQMNARYTEPVCKVQ